MSFELPYSPDNSDPTPDYSIRGNFLRLLGGQQARPSLLPDPQNQQPQGFDLRPRRVLADPGNMPTPPQPVEVPAQIAPLSSPPDVQGRALTIVPRDGAGPPAIDIGEPPPFQLRPREAGGISYHPELDELYAIALEGNPRAVAAVTRPRTTGLVSPPPVSPEVAGGQRERFATAQPGADDELGLFSRSYYDPSQNGSQMPLRPRLTQPVDQSQQDLDYLYSLEHSPIEKTFQGGFKNRLKLLAAGVLRGMGEGKPGEDIGTVVGRGVGKGIAYQVSPAQLAQDLRDDEVNRTRQNITQDLQLRGEQARLDALREQGDHRANQDELAAERLQSQELGRKLAVLMQQYGHVGRYDPTDASDAGSQSLKSQAEALGVQLAPFSKTQKPPRTFILNGRWHTLGVDPQGRPFAAPLLDQNDQPLPTEATKTPNSQGLTPEQAQKQALLEKREASRHAEAEARARASAMRSSRLSRLDRRREMNQAGAAVTQLDQATARAQRYEWRAETTKDESERQVLLRQAQQERRQALFLAQRINNEYGHLYEVKGQWTDDGFIPDHAEPRNAPSAQSQAEARLRAEATRQGLNPDEAVNRARLQKRLK